MNKRLLTIALVAGALALTGCGKENDNAIFETSVKHGNNVLIDANEKKSGILNFVRQEVKPFEVKQVELNLKNSVLLNFQKGKAEVFSGKTKVTPKTGMFYLDQHILFSRVDTKINIYEKVSLNSPYKENIKLFSQVRTVDAKKCTNGKDGYVNNTVVSEDLSKELADPITRPVNTAVLFKRGFKSQVSVCLGSDDTIMVESDFSYFEPVVTR